MDSNPNDYENYAAISTLLQDSAAFNNYLTTAMNSKGIDPNLRPEIIQGACPRGGGSASGVTRALPSMLAMLLIIAIGHGR